MTLRDQVGRAIAVADGTNMAVREAHGIGIPDVNLRQADAAIGVVVAALATQIEALYAEPPVVGAYRNEPGGMWFHGTGNDRTGLIGHGPSEAEVLALVRGAGGVA